ncbi:MAG: conjugal transfer protein TraG N-terminal domain-containing protein [Candidatus Obscuribacterales bacterium]
MALTIVTYGGGEVLEKVFNAIAMLMNGHSGDFFRPILLITATIGGIWALGKAFFSGSVSSLISRYFLPVLMVFGLLCVPTTSVHIEDVLNREQKPHKVDHVPLFVANFAKIVSSVGYHITAGLEKVMHVPDDLQYSKTGMLFGADTALEADKITLTNGDLERNLERFAKQCVLYDIALGRYSIDDLKKTTDLWGFLEANTSNVRMIPYAQPAGTKQGRGVSTSPSAEYLSCQAALKEMRPLFDKEKEYYAKQEITKNLPLTFQAITGVAQSREKLIGQQLMMEALSGSYSGDSLATSRASNQQRSTYLILGSLASKSLVAMRVIFEALIYASVIFVIPLALLPGGLRFLGTWMSLALWIQLWPPFYAILNYVMQIYAHGQIAAIFPGGPGEQGLSFFTRHGLRELNSDLFALAGYLAVSIPFLSYALLKGGISSFIHLAGSMMTPAHSAAGTAAAEQASGNYSYGNVSYGQTQYGNTTAHQASLAPAISSGFFSDNRGTSSLLYGSQENILKQSNSELRTSLFGDASSNQSAQEVHQRAYSLAQQDQKSHSDSLSSYARDFVDYARHVSQSDNFATSLSSREGYDVQHSARELETMAANWGDQYGLSRRESLEVLGALGASGNVGGRLLSFVSFGAGIEGKLSTSRGDSRDNILSSAFSVSQSEDFQSHYQKVIGSTKSEALSHLNDEGGRFAYSVSQALDRVDSTQRSTQASQSVLDQVSSALHSSSSTSHQVRDSLNQDFINWASDGYADRGGMSYVSDMITSGSPSQKGELIDGFLQHAKSEQYAFSKPLPADPSLVGTAHRAKHGYSDTQLTEVNLGAVADRTRDIATAAADQGIVEGAVSHHGRLAEAKHVAAHAGYEHHRTGAQQHIADQQGSIDSHREQRLAQGKLSGAIRGPGDLKGQIGNYRFNTPPMWMHSSSKGE